MYGPPAECKRETRGQVGLRKCIRPLLERFRLLAMMECAALSSYLTSQS
jgi:hypothetical protein